MLKNSRPIAFLATAKPEGSKRFYTATLGLSLLEDTPFAVVIDVGGTVLRIQKVKSFVPATHTVFGWSVENIETIVKNLANRKPKTTSNMIIRSA